MPISAQQLSQVVINEWDKWGTYPGTPNLKSQHLESQAKFSPIVHQYWQSIGADLDGTSPYAWSAAFICFCIKQIGYTGHDFPLKSYHSEYCAYIYAGKYPKFSLLDPELTPVQVGDIICKRRPDANGNYHEPLTYYSAISFYNNILVDDNNNFDSHSDIVIEVNDGTILAVGGNVSDAVASSTYDLTSNGGLNMNDAPFLAIIRINS
ncbi:TPA: DUF2272 domain-containing protein [Klebsiella aerogenes]|uniref:DUF2272 domain-containing protein n=1 Tax=Klebsiella TaxID=570 RepID=UPI002927C4AB|nr:DUF2272 domain-containing protein [Klebsiella sp. 141203]MDU9365232.1 DUF2272 domain-containing protein [Klebsiella sp. 141203]HEP0584806.1 DUF2272 domain-containing protein [Klebsiella aerogenes]